MLSQQVLQELDSKEEIKDEKKMHVHFQISGAADYFEIASSSKETEYSMNPINKEVK